MSKESLSTHSPALAQAMLEAQLQSIELTPAQLHEVLQQKGRELYNKLNSWFLSGQISNLGMFEYHDSNEAGFQGILALSSEQLLQIQNTALRAQLSDPINVSGICITKTTREPREANDLARDILSVKIGYVPFNFENNRMVDPHTHFVSNLDRHGEFQTGLAQTDSTPPITQLDYYNRNAALIQTACLALGNSWIINMEELTQLRKSQVFTE